MMWARRLIIGSGLAVTSLLVAPTVAGAAASCVSPSTMNEPGCVVTPAIAAASSTPAAASALPFDGTPAATAPTSTTSSLPFTGADVEELAVVGAGAVLVGGLLIRRRRPA
jgi:hypothetical protein